MLHCDLLVEYYILIGRKNSAFALVCRMLHYDWSGEFCILIDQEKVVGMMQHFDWSEESGIVTDGRILLGLVIPNTMQMSFNQSNSVSLSLEKKT